MARWGSASVRWSSWSAADRCEWIRADPYRTSPASSACNRKSPSAAARPPDAGRDSASPWARSSASRASRRIAVRPRAHSRSIGRQRQRADTLGAAGKNLRRVSCTAMLRAIHQSDASRARIQRERAVHLMSEAAVMALVIRRSGSESAGSFVKHLIEIQKFAGQHSQSSVFAMDRGRIRLVFALIQKFARIVSMAAVVRGISVECLLRDRSLMRESAPAPAIAAQCNRAGHRSPHSPRMLRPANRETLPRTAHRSW